MVLALLLWPYLFCYVNNPDAYSYLNIAKQYSSGSLSSAVNGCWSPLLSWLFVPFILLGFQSVIAFKLVQLIIALIAFHRWQKIIDQKIVSHRLLFLLKLAGIPFFLSFAFVTQTADLLFLTLTLIMIEWMMNVESWTSNISFSIKLGIVGGLLYLSKAFGFPFFVMLLFFSLWHQRMIGNKINWKNVIRAFSVFILISSTWITIISMKYGHFTISEAARFNFTKEVAPLPGQIIQMPILSEGLTVPSSANAISAWEDPMLSTRLAPLHPFNSESDKDHAIGVIERNIKSMWYFDFKWQTGIFFLMILIIALLFRRKEINFREAKYFYPMITVLLFYGGYSLILFHPRYTWICTLMMLLMSTNILLSFTNSNYKILRAFSIPLYLLILLLAIKRPVKEILFAEDADTTASDLFFACLNPFTTLNKTYVDDRLVYNASLELSKSGLIKSPIASRYSKNLFRHRYSSSLQVATENNVQYFGQIDDMRVGAIEELQKAGINYFLIWDDDSKMWQGKSPIYSSGPMNVYSVE